MAELDRGEVDALNEALDDEYQACGPRHASLREACEAGVAAEIANGSLYERLLSATERPDILAVFRRLQQASLQRHLPAFRRCAARR